ncbi:MAG: pyridoxamine 5'-phosphate oxidase family protein [Acidobacteriota bacterium]
MTRQIKPTDRTGLQRIPKRGSFDLETIYGILDEGFICHLGFAVEGQPFVIPTGYARIGDQLMIHGSAASRTLRAVANQIDVCVTVTLIDGLVLARSAFHHSMNYRSVVIYGKARLVADAEEKNVALKAFTEHIIPGRWDDVRHPTDLELKATTVLKLPIDEASAKVREGGPIDEEEDYDLDIWAGVIPLTVGSAAPLDDERLKPGLDAPSNTKNYRRVK